MGKFQNCANQRLNGIDIRTKITENVVKLLVSSARFSAGAQRESRASEAKAHSTTDSAACACGARRSSDASSSGCSGAGADTSCAADRCADLRLRDGCRQTDSRVLATASWRVHVGARIGRFIFGLHLRPGDANSCAIDDLFPGHRTGGGPLEFSVRPFRSLCTRIMRLYF